MQYELKTKRSKSTQMLGKRLLSELSIDKMSGEQGVWHRGTETDSRQNKKEQASEKYSYQKTAVCV